MTGVTLLSAPTNLGLRPPVPTATPGCAKAPEVLRAAGLHERLGAADAGLVRCPRYVDDARRGRIRNQDAILDYSIRLAGRLTALLDEGRRPLVLGGDCSLLLGIGLALRRRGRYGLLHIDGHTDFRHPGNSDMVASLAGEDLAAAVGLHYPAVSLLGGEQHFRPDDVVQVGCRDDDEAMDEAGALLAVVVPASHVVRQGVPAVIDPIVTTVTRPELDGYWIHVDLDVLDESVMQAVDSPSPGGLSPDQLIELLQALAPNASGAHVGIYDPDLDPEGTAAQVVVDCIVEGLAGLGTNHSRDRAS